MRLITRSDFDGLACGALLKEAGIIDNWKFAHPKDLQDGLVEVTKDDCLANVPFVPGCGLWFDHHSSEHERNELKGKYKGTRKQDKGESNLGGLIFFIIILPPIFFETTVQTLVSVFIIWYKHKKENSNFC